MGKINTNDLMRQFDDMDALINDAESARQEIISNSLQDMVEDLIIESFTNWFNEEADINLSSTYLKGRRTKVSDKNFTKMITAMAPAISRDSIIVLKDTTFFDADEGMIITADKVYFKNSEDSGEINILDMVFVYTNCSFWGNIVDITDNNGRVWHLGQISALEEALNALNEAFSDIISGVKKLKDEK